MYIICYGKSPKALETGKQLIDDIGGRYVTGTELMTGSFVVAQGEVSCAIVMVLPLEAAIKAMEETVTDKTRGLPVIAVSPEGRYAAILRRGNKPYDKGCDDVYSAIVKSLGSFCFSSFEGKAGITGDLTSLVSRFGMSVNDEGVFEKMNSKICSGEKVDVYTDLPIVFADPVIDPMTYSLHTYPYDMREDFIKQYKAAKEGKIQPSVFITCTYLGEEEVTSNLILVPKILSLDWRSRPRQIPVTVLLRSENPLSTTCLILRRYQRLQQHIQPGKASSLRASLKSSVRRSYPLIPRRSPRQKCPWR